MKVEKVLISVIIISIIFLILHYTEILYFRYTPKISTYVILIAIIYLIINKAKENI